MHKLLEKFRKPETGELCLPCVIGSAVLLVVAIVAIWLVTRSGAFRKDDALPAELTQERVDEIVQHGQVLLTARLQAGEDLSAGPCLDNNETYPGWVIDIVHDPREPIDDDPENQCSAYRRGDAKYFVELSVAGDIVRMDPDLREAVEDPGI